DPDSESGIIQDRVAQVRERQLARKGASRPRTRPRRWRIVGACSRVSTSRGASRRLPGRDDMPAVRIDRSKPLAAEPHTGHNRYHPDIEPALEVNEGEEVILETRDALDGQLPPTATVADFATLNTGAIHPLTGPVFV